MHSRVQQPVFVRLLWVILSVYQIIAHDWARRDASSDELESGARKGGEIAGARRTRRQICIQRVGFESAGPCVPGGVDSGLDERSRDTPPAIALAHKKTRE